jgi:hypothetical protein
MAICSTNGGTAIGSPETVYVSRIGIVAVDAEDLSHFSVILT